jgi:hypothetical protein
VSRLIFAVFALWQKDVENRFFSVRNTYLFPSSRMWSVLPAVLLIVFCNPVQIQGTWRIFEFSEFEHQSSAREEPRSLQTCREGTSHSPTSCVVSLKSANDKKGSIAYPFVGRAAYPFEGRAAITYPSAGRVCMS